jgi:hypothetical protein
MKTGLMDKDQFKKLGFVTGDEKEDTRLLNPVIFWRNCSRIGELILDVGEVVSCG